MSFWQTSAGENVTENVEKEYDAGGGYTLIPDKTNCLMMIHSAGWDKDRDGNRYVKIRWDAIKPEAVAKTVTFQKIWCADFNPKWKPDEAQKKRDKALRMLAAIDANSGGKLAKAGCEPDDDDLALALTNKQMMAKVMVWEIDGKEGNWIAAIGSKGGSLAITDLAELPKREAKKPVDEDYDIGDVPF